MKPYDDPRFPTSRRSSDPPSSQESRRFDASEVSRPSSTSRKRSNSNAGDAWNKIASELERIDALGSEYNDFDWNERVQDGAVESPKEPDSADFNVDEVCRSDVSYSNESARDSLRRAANALSNESRTFFDDDKLSEDYETRNKRRSQSVWRSGDWRSYQNARTTYDDSSSYDRRSNVSNRSRLNKYDSNQRQDSFENKRDYDRRRYETSQNSPRCSKYSDRTERLEFTRRDVRRDEKESKFRRNGARRDGDFREIDSRRNDPYYNSVRASGVDYDKTDYARERDAHNRPFFPERNGACRPQPPRRRPTPKPSIGIIGKYGEPLSLAEAYGRRDGSVLPVQSLEELKNPSSNQPGDAFGLNSAELAVLSEKSIYELIEEARRLDGDPRGQIVKRVLRERVVQAGMTFGVGTLEILPDGFGFLRSVDASYLSCSDDVYVSPSQIRRFGLRCGLVVSGLIRPPKERERYFALLRIDSINGKDPNLLTSTPYFDDLVAARPTERLKFERQSGNNENAILEGTTAVPSGNESPAQEKSARSSLFDASSSPTFIEAAEASQGRDMRLLDLVLPVGFGQRALIVCPPRSGKTLFIRKMIRAALENYDDLFALVLLVKKRPEDVTETRRLLSSDRCEVVGTTFDESDVRHVQVAHTLFEKAKRMVEYGRRVAVFVDSLTRLIDSLHGGEYGEPSMSSALQYVRKLFGSSRKIDGGGSLTVFATSLWDKDSPDAQIELDALQNVSHATLWLDSELAEKAVWPPIDVVKSAARDCRDFVSGEEGLLLEKIRKNVQSQNATEALAELLDKIDRTSSNLELQLASTSDSSEK